MSTKRQLHFQLSRDGDDAWWERQQNRFRSRGVAVPDADWHPQHAKRADTASWENQVVALVGCGKAKAPDQCAAEDLYTGSLFRAARAHVEARGWAWAILSAKHGVVLPDTPLRPYDLHISELDENARGEWTSRVRQQLALLFPRCEQFVCFAGAAYAKALRVPFGADVSFPLGALTLGRRLKWFKEQRLAAAPSFLADENEGGADGEDDEGREATEDARDPEGRGQ